MVCFVVVTTGICSGNESFGQVVYDSDNRHGIGLQSMPVYVITKGVRGSKFAGGKMVIPLGQYIVDQNGNMINVTGFSMQELFKVGLTAYGIINRDKNKTIKRIIRYVDSVHIIYIFDY